MLKMKKLWAVAVIALAGLVAAPNQVLAANTCADLLLDKAYFCTFKSESFEFDDTLVFSKDEVGFSVESDDNNIGSGLCDCQAKGSFNNPKFAESTSFLCTSEEPIVGKLFALEGKAVAGGKKIKKGQFTGDAGLILGTLTGVFECEVVEEPSYGDVE